MIKAKYINEFERSDDNPHKKMKVGNYTKKIMKVEPNTSMDFKDVLFTDPCYIFDNDTQDDIWQEFVGHMFSKEGKEKELDTEGTMTYGYPGDPELIILYTSTAHGDGEYKLYYKGSEIGSLPVDAGMISAIPLELAKKFSGQTEAELSNLGVIVKAFNGHVQVGDYGIHGSGGLSVVTDGSDEDEYCDWCGESIDYCRCDEPTCEWCGEYDDECTCEYCDNCGENENDCTCEEEDY